MKYDTKIFRDDISDGIINYSRRTDLRKCPEQLDGMKRREK